MKTKKSHIGILITSVLLLITTVVIINPFKKDIWDVNEELLKEKILSMSESDKLISLSDITPFNWDTMYSFNPYISRESVYEIVGYKWDDIFETVNEGMNQIVFMKDKKVVCYIYGYGENNGYYMAIGYPENNKVKTLSKLDNPQVKVKKNNNINVLVFED